MGSLSGQRFKLQTPSDSVKAVQSAIPDDADFVTVGGLTGLNKEFQATEIDATTQSSNENKEILDGHGIKSFPVSADGQTKDSQIYKDLELAAASNKLRWFRLVKEDDNNRSYTAKFKITSLSEAGVYDGVLTFSLSLASSGAVTIS